MSSVVLEPQEVSSPNVSDYARQSSYVTPAPPPEDRAQTLKSPRLSNDQTMLEVAEANGDKDLIGMARKRLEDDLKR